MGKKTNANEELSNSIGDLVDTLSMTSSELAANRQRKKMNKGIIEAITSFESLEQELNNTLINTLNSNFNSLNNVLEKQNRDLIKQNKLLIRLLNNFIDDKDNILENKIPQNIHCPNCREEFYSTNKSYYEDYKCPYCNHDFEKTKPLKIKKTEKIEEGICPYCESELHTNDLICPTCYEKLTPIYDELIEEQLKKEKEKREKDEKVLWDNEADLFEYYSKLIVEQNYSENDAKKRIISQHNITNVDLLEKMSESRKWDERLKVKIENKEQANEFLKEKEDELFEVYHDLIVNKKYSETDAKEELLKKYNITNTFIIKKLNSGIWSKWNRKIKSEKRLIKNKIFKTYCELILDEKQSEDAAMKRIIEDYNITNDEFLEMKKLNYWDKRLTTEKKKRDEEEKNKYLNAIANYKKTNEKPCPICGQTNEKDSKYCINCQHDFSKERRFTKFTKSYEKKVCPKCKSYNEVNFNYCKTCGYKFSTENKKEDKNSKICPKCGAENGMGSNFCISCGNNL